MDQIKQVFLYLSGIVLFSLILSHTFSYNSEEEVFIISDSSGSYYSNVPELVDALREYEKIDKDNKKAIEGAISLRDEKLSLLSDYWLGVVEKRQQSIIANDRNVFNFEDSKIVPQEILNQLNKIDEFSSFKPVYGPYRIEINGKDKLLMLVNQDYFLSLENKELRIHKYHVQPKDVSQIRRVIFVPRLHWYYKKSSRLMCDTFLSDTYLVYDITDFDSKSVDVDAKEIFYDQTSMNLTIFDFSGVHSLLLEASQCLRISRIEVLT